MGILSSLKSFFSSVKQVILPTPIEIQIAETKEELAKTKKELADLEAEEKTGDFRRKIAKTIYYCEGKGLLGHKIRRLVFGLTFENNRIDRFDRIVDEIESVFGNQVEQQYQPPKIHDETRGGLFAPVRGCVRISDYGYSDTDFFRNPSFVWPQIEVGEE